MITFGQQEAPALAHALARSGLILSWDIVSRSSDRVRKLLAVPHALPGQLHLLSGHDAGPAVPGRWEQDVALRVIAVDS